MAKTIRKHWDMALMVGFGLFLMIAAIITVKTAVPIPFQSVQAATTSATTVDVTATVAETIEITVSSSDMDLGALSASSISSTTNNFVVKTNAGSGYTVNLKDKDYAATTSLPGLHKLSAPTSTIASASTTLVADTEGYGAQGTTTDSDVTISTAYRKTGTQVGKLEITDQAFATSSSATLGDQSTIILQATISSITAAGSYVDQLTLTAVGSF